MHATMHEVENHLTATTRATNKDIFFKPLIFANNFVIFALMHFSPLTNYYYRFNHITSFGGDGAIYVLKIVFFI